LALFIEEGSESHRRSAPELGAEEAAPADDMNSIIIGQANKPNDVYPRLRLSNASTDRMVSFL
jgi:hypothetical protein